MSAVALNKKENNNSEFGKVVYFPNCDINDKKQSKQNKRKKKKSEVYPFEIEDLKKMILYFQENSMWLHLLLFTFGCNMARRISDTLSLQWYHIFDPKTGLLRKDILPIAEQKTDKLANPKINSACREAINMYIEKTGCNPSLNNYREYVFMQLSGTYKGHIMSSRGYLKALKKAAAYVGIKYNVGTHSTRKTFGMMSRMLHPSDYNSMELLQTIYNHSDTKITKHYIGLTKQEIDRYYDDMGDFFNDYVTGDKVYHDISSVPIVSINANDLKDVIKLAYERGRDNAHSTDAMQHIDTITDILKLVEQLEK